jgi:sugar phosphate isomerase/epimerase
MNAALSPSPQARLALSTCWCSHRHTDGFAMLAEMRELGFSRVELSHGVPVYLVPGILRGIDEGVIEVGSVHNFCPLPSEVDRAAPNLFQPSARHGLEGRAWLRHSLQTFELAKRVGASHVVLHSGSVFFPFLSPAKAFAPGAGETGGRREKALARLQKRSLPALDRVEANFRSLLAETAGSGVRLAVENREGILELPPDSELAAFVNRFDPSEVVYWHDTGHAEIKRRLGLLDPDALLERLADRLAGFHLHDVDASGRDHQAIGSGAIDFRKLAATFRPHHLLVLELHPRVTAEEVRASRDRILEAAG